MSFLRNLLATVTGLFIFFIFLFFIFIGIVFMFDSDETVHVKQNSVLYLNFSGTLMERIVDDPFAEIISVITPNRIGLFDILRSIKNAKNDDNMRGIYMEHQYLVADHASLKEIRDALIDFKQSGKFIYSYGNYISEGDYYIASVADSIYLHAEGSFEFNGLSVNVTFWKGLFDKLEIQPEIFRVGQYKSFVEPFIRKDMSEENRFQYSELLNSIYDIYIESIADSRNIDTDQLHQISSKLQIQVPKDALQYGLVDVIGFKDQVKETIANKVGEEKAKDINFISHKKYKKAIKNNYSKNKIAVIIADGNIVLDGDEYSIVGERFAKEIRKARENSAVKAIVLRINSPGGSLLASDLIWREISLTKGKKPIIASMSGVAASGGYYIAMNADTIIAQPNTITGSIGIFGILFNVETFLENKLGITHDVVKTGEHSDIYTVTRELTAFERSVIQKSVDQGYKTFITKVAAGRGVTPEEIDKIGGGRVWTGQQAKELGLVDLLGSFEDAINLAANVADIEEDFSIRYYPEQKPFIEQIFKKLSDETRANIFIKTNIISKYTEEIEYITNMQGLQARMPVKFIIQ